MFSIMSNVICCSIVLIFYTLTTSFCSLLMTYSYQFRVSRYFILCFRCDIIVSGILARACNRFKKDRPTSAQDSFLDSANRRSADLNESLRSVSVSFPRVLFADHCNFQMRMLSTDGLHLRPEGVETLADDLLTAIHASVLSVPAPDCPCFTEKDFPVLCSTDAISSPSVVSLAATSSSHNRYATVVVPEQVSTGMYDWLKATGDGLGAIEGISFVWNDTGAQNSTGDDDDDAGDDIPIVPIVPIVHNSTGDDDTDVPFPLHVDGNDDDWDILSAGGKDDDTDVPFPLHVDGNDDDWVILSAGGEDDDTDAPFPLHVDGNDDDWVILSAEGKDDDTDVPFPLHVDGNDDDWVMLSAGGKDDDTDAPFPLHVDGNDEDCFTLSAGGKDDVSATGERAVPYTKRDVRFTPAVVRRILCSFNDDPNVLNTANRIPPTRPCGNDV